MTGVSELDTLDSESPSAEALRNSFAASKFPGMKRFFLPLVLAMSTHAPSMRDLKHSFSVLTRSWHSKKEIGVSFGSPCTSVLAGLVGEADVSWLLMSGRSIHEGRGLVQQYQGGYPPPRSTSLPLLGQVASEPLRRDTHCGGGFCTQLKTGTIRQQQPQRHTLGQALLHCGTGKGLNKVAGNFWYY